METWTVIWLSSGAIAFAVDLWIWYLRLSGQLGVTVQEYAWRYAALNGGCRQLALTILFASFLFPPVALLCCITTFLMDWQAYKLTRTRPR